MTQNYELLFLSVQCDISFIVAIVRKTIGLALDPLPDQGNAGPDANQGVRAKTVDCYKPTSVCRHHQLWVDLRLSRIHLDS